MADMRNLIESFDQSIRESFKDYYIVSKSRMDNLVFCYESGAKRIKQLTDMVNEQQEVIEKLSKELAGISTP